MQMAGRGSFSCALCCSSTASILNLIRPNLTQIPLSSILLPPPPTKIIIKPDAVQRGLVGTIISRFEARGFEILKMKVTTPTSDVVDKHYAEHVKQVSERDANKKMGER